MSKRCRHRRPNEQQLEFAFANGGTMPKVPDLPPGSEEAFQRSNSSRISAENIRAVGEAMKRGSWEVSPEDAYTERLAEWRPKVKVINWTTLNRAVRERTKFIHEWTEWHVGTPDGRPLPGAELLWRVDGANAIAKELKDAADTVVREAVLEARKAGETWSDIAEHLNITKSAAIARYGRPDEDEG